MSNTQPEKRLNKHGVLVTKHVLATPKTKTNSKGLPAPSIGVMKNLEDKPVKVKAPKAASLVKMLNQRDIELLGPLAGRAKEYGYEQPSIDKFQPETRNRIAEFISKAKKEDIRILHDLFARTYDEENRFAAVVQVLPFARAVNNAYFDSYGDTAADDISNIYSNLKLNDFRGTIDDYHIGVIKTEHLAKAIGLRSSNFSVPHQYYQQVEMLRQNLDKIESALPLVIATANNKGWGGISAEEALEVAEYGQQHLGKMDMLAEAIKERGGFDAELLDEFLNNSAPAMSEGLL